MEQAYETLLNNVRTTNPEIHETLLNNVKSTNPELYEKFKLKK